mmetsp:Transcript_32055/g.77815  ORF Transcript_32055/g.77815 Transcript_32055/m.77815 type:complete len:235 (+) Transcript_32055:113-817(+)
MASHDEVLSRKQPRLCLSKCSRHLGQQTFENRYTYDGEHTWKADDRDVVQVVRAEEGDGIKHTSPKLILEQETVHPQLRGASPSSCYDRVELRTRPLLVPAPRDLQYSGGALRDGAILELLDEAAEFLDLFGSLPRQVRHHVLQRDEAHQRGRKDGIGVHVCEIASLRHRADHDDLVNVQAEDDRQGEAEPRLKCLRGEKKGEERKAHKDGDDDDEVTHEVERTPGDLDRDFAL